MDTFAKHVDDLSPDLRCITLDNRGTGGSDAPVAACTIDAMARDALALVAELQLSAGVHVVGQSMGGMIAQRMAVLEPDAVRSLTLCSTVAWIDGRTRAYWGSLPTLAATLSPLRLSSRLATIGDCWRGMARQIPRLKLCLNLAAFAFGRHFN